MHCAPKSLRPCAFICLRAFCHMEHQPRRGCFADTRRVTFKCRVGAFSHCGGLELPNRGAGRRLARLVAMALPFPAIACSLLCMRRDTQSSVMVAWKIDSGVGFSMPSGLLRLVCVEYVRRECARNDFDRRLTLTRPPSTPPSHDGGAANVVTCRLRHPRDAVCRLQTPRVRAGILSSDHKLMVHQVGASVRAVRAAASRRALSHKFVRYGASAKG